MIINKKKKFYIEIYLKFLLRNRNINSIECSN